MTSFHFGIDVAKAKLDCALRLPNGKHRAKVVSNTPDGFAHLLAWVATHKAESPHVCMEATGIYWEGVAQFLATEGLIVSVVNPAQIKSYGASRLTRTKTDAVDARLIADFCHERNPTPWQAMSEAEITLRALVLRLEALQTMRTQESNRLLVSRDAVHDNIQQHLDWLDAEIERLIKTIKNHINTHPSLKQQGDLLDTIPGIGERTIAVILAFYSDTSRSQTAGKLQRLQALIPDNMSLAAALKASHVCLRSGMLFYVNPCICQLW